jgi:hypothetical protein
VNEPSKCPNAACQAKFSMQMVYNRSCFLDKQLMKMQENPNEIPEGETPHTVSMFARQVRSQHCCGCDSMLIGIDKSKRCKDVDDSHFDLITNVGLGGSGQARRSHHCDRGVPCYGCAHQPTPA